MILYKLKQYQIEARTGEVKVLTHIVVYHKTSGSSTCPGSQ